MESASVYSLIIGAVLGLVASVIGQLLFWTISLRHNKNTIIASLRAELKVLREDLSSNIEGFRISLRQSQSPSPLVFERTTFIFDSVVGQLGQLRDNDLVEHFVEVYSLVKSLGDEVGTFRNVPKQYMTLTDLNQVYVGAVSTQVAVLKLHNRLKGQNYLDVDNDSESESLKDFAKHSDEIVAEGFGRLMSRTWAS